MSDDVNLSSPDFLKIPYLRKKDTGWWEAACPFCDRDSKRVLQISPDLGFAHCFRCLWKGSLLEVLRKLSLKTDGLDSIPKDTSHKDSTEVKPYLEIDTEELPIYTSKLALSYLARRNALDIALIQHWKFKRTGMFTDRIVIPIYFNKMLVGKVDRMLYNIKPKYKFTVGFPSQKVFYNWDLTVGKSTLVITEGVFDCISASKALPFVGVVGNFGKHISECKRNLLENANLKEVVIMFDSPTKDPDMNKAIAEAMLMLNGSFKLSIATLQEGDPNEVPAKMVQEAYFTRKGVA